jgi:hypothetical protein
MKQRFHICISMAKIITQRSTELASMATGRISHDELIKALLDDIRIQKEPVSIVSS